MKHSKDRAEEIKELETQQEAADGQQEGAEAQTPDEAAGQPDASQLQESLTKAEAQRDEYLNMAQRVQADFDNFRRRNASVRSEAFDDGAAAFIKTILPVCDNFDRAMEQGSADEALLSGMRLVYKQLMEALEKRGVTVISRQGEVFDPHLEDAVVQGTPEEGEPGTVAQVLLKGYKLGDTVLRHAMVKVIVD